MEHGAVVMAYNPCLSPDTVDSLRKLVTGCIRSTAELHSHSFDVFIILTRKHIITPVYNMPKGVPLALVAWGCRLEMTEVDPDKVKKFIRDRGLQGGIANEVPFLNIAKIIAKQG